MRHALVLLTLLCGCGRISFDARGFAIDDTGNGVTSANSVTSLDLTTLAVGTGANECLIASLVLSNQSASGVALRWNGALLTPVTSEMTSGTSGIVFVHRLIAPDAGLQTLSAEWTGESDAVLGAVSVSGADQSECVAAVATGRGSSDTASVTVASAPGHLTLDVSVATPGLGAPAQQPRWMATADGAPRLIQQATHTVLATTDDCTLAAPASAGHTLLFIGGASVNALQSVTGGATWQKVVLSTANSNVEIWVGEAPTSENTITYVATASSSMRCWVGEFTGLVPASSLDSTTSNQGSTGPADPLPLVTTNAHDLLVVGYSIFGQPSWGDPTEGPWTSLGEVADPSDSQIAFVQPVVATGTWDPSITQTSTDPRWDAAAAAFRISSAGISAASSTAAGAASNVHTWSLDSTSAWASVGLDVFP